MLGHPFTGVGPNNWPNYAAARYGLPRVHSHSIWLQAGAEMGMPGLLFLLAFYGICMLRLWPIARGKTPVPDPWLRDAARMVIASLTAFMVAGSFISLSGLEQAYYITMLGAATLKILSAHQPHPLAFQPEPLPEIAPEPEPTGVA
jgi:O-antigen ligase